ncbi:MAG: CHAT domain-containing protein, partial [Leptolyngbyaceae bacterium]|nr:CHAT domain-containing protein [Leptolyngbyaceae bacterium]
MTQEFHLSITPIRSDEYLVRTEEVAPGVPLAEEQYVWPTAEWLDQARQLMNDPIVGLLQGDRLSSLNAPAAASQNQAQTASTLTVLGQQLYSHLFQGRLRDSWMTAQGIAQHRGEALRLRLGLKGNLLPGLPWEVLNGGERDGFHLSSQHLATGVNILFSRYLADAGMGNALGYQTIPKPQQTIKILMAIAAPTDQQQLKLNQEAHHLQEELRLKANVLKAGGAHLLPDIRVTILEQPGREELAQALEQGQFNIFHYAGHSELGEAGGKIYLVNRQTGLSETLNGNDLAGLLLNNDIQMAVLNSCRGAQTATAASDTQRPSGTLTHALVTRGIPAVLAMAEQIPDDVALSLTRLFYRNLKQGYPVDLSLSRARQGLLSAYSSDQLYWALPTLYLHPDFDGYLTAGDRSLENPADSLIRLPHLHASPLTEAIASVTPDQDYDSHPGEPVAQNVTQNISQNVTPNATQTATQNITGSAFPSSSLASSDQPPLSRQEPEEPLADVNAENASADEISILEPQDAPVLAEKPDLPDDFFLGDDDLQGFDDDLADDDVNLDEADSVRNLVEQLEGGQSPSEAIAPTDDSTTDFTDLPLNTYNEAHYPHDSETSYGLEEHDSSLDQGYPVHNGYYPSNDSDVSDDIDSDEIDNEIAHDLSMVTDEQDVYSSHSVFDDDSHPAPHGLLPSSAEPDDEESSSALNRVDAENDLHAGDEDDASVDPALLRQRQSSPWKKLLWLPIASVAGAAIVFLGYKFLPNVTTLSSNPEETPVLRDDVNRSNLSEKSTQRVSEFGIASFSVNNVEDGQAAIVELLNRDELD